MIYWRKMWDSNPRKLALLTVFETAPFNHLGNPPSCLLYNISANKKTDLRRFILIQSFRMIDIGNFLGADVTAVDADLLMLSKLLEIDTVLVQDDGSSQHQESK